MCLSIGILKSLCAAECFVSPLGILRDVCEMCAIMTVLSLLGCAPDHGKEEALKLSAVSCLPLIHSLTHYRHCTYAFMGHLQIMDMWTCFWCSQLELSLEMSPFYSTFQTLRKYNITCKPLKQFKKL